jgi:hypothetical protein
MRSSIAGRLPGEQAILRLIGGTIDAAYPASGTCAAAWFQPYNQTPLSGTAIPSPVIP